VVGVILFLASRTAQFLGANQREREARRLELLRLAQEIRTELETARYQLDKAQTQRQGWHIDDMLPAEKFDAWQKSSVTGEQTDVFEALRGYYIWSHRMNMAMQTRQRNEYN
jgi:hypothetical protein